MCPVPLDQTLSIVRAANADGSKPRRVRDLLWYAAHPRVGRRSNFPVARLLDALGTMGVHVTDRGLISHDLFPPSSLFDTSVKGLVPYLRDAVCFPLSALLQRRIAKRDKLGRLGRSDFAQLDPNVDWDVIRWALFPDTHPLEDAAPGSSPLCENAYLSINRSKAIICGHVWRPAVDGPSFHKEPISPSLPAPGSPNCSFCDMLVPETLNHIFWECPSCP